MGRQAVQLWAAGDSIVLLPSYAAREWTHLIFMLLSPALMSAFGFAEPHTRGRG